MNDLDRTNRKIAKKLRQQNRKKALATGSSERDISENSVTETDSAVQNPYKTALQVSDGNIARESNNSNKGVEEDAVNDDEKIDLPKFKNTDNVLEMSAHELSKFLEAIVENHIKSKRKIDPDLSI